MRWELGKCWKEREDREFAEAAKQIMAWALGQVQNTGAR